MSKVAKNLEVKVVSVSQHKNRGTVTLAVSPTEVAANGNTPARLIAEAAVSFEFKNPSEVSEFLFGDEYTVTLTKKTK